MSTTTYPLTTARSAPATTMSRSLKAEWTKLRTLRSTWRTVAAALVISIGLGTAIVASQVAQWDTMTVKQHQAFDATSTTMIGLLFASVVLGALAVRSMTAEYATGMIRSTFAALPARRAVLAAKAATMAAFVFPVALVSNLVGFEIGQRLLAAKHAQVSLGHPGVVPAMVFGALAVSLVTVIGVGPGRRHPAHRWGDHGAGAGPHRGRRVRPLPPGRLPPIPARDAPSRPSSPCTARPDSCGPVRQWRSLAPTPASPCGWRRSGSPTATPEPNHCQQTGGPGRPPGPLARFGLATHAVRPRTLPFRDGGYPTTSLRCHVGIRAATNRAWEAGPFSAQRHPDPLPA